MLYFIEGNAFGFPDASVVKNMLAVQETQETLIQSRVWKIPWRRKWQPTPVFLPENPQGQRSLVGYSPGGRPESDTTERLNNNDFSFVVPVAGPSFTPYPHAGLPTCP